MSSDEMQQERLTRQLEATQSDETALFASLDDPDLTPAQRTSIIDSINRSARTRIALYRALQAIYRGAQAAQQQEKELLARQIQAIEAIEMQMNARKRELNKLRGQKQDVLRLVQISDYYSGQYSAQGALLRTVALFCLPAVGLSLLHRFGFLPSMLYGLLAILLLVYATYVIGPMIVDLSNRDPMVWDQYLLAFHPPGGPSESTP